LSLCNERELEQRLKERDIKHMKFSKSGFKKLLREKAGLID
jgi:hypothetical protein